MHHIVSDEWSNKVFFTELITIYQALVASETSPLSPLPIQYADFAVWQRQRLQGETLKTKLNYWKQKLGGTLPVLELPTDYPRPKVQTYNGSYELIEVSPEITTKIKSLSTESEVTLFITLLTAFNTLLHRYSDRDDIIIGSPIAGRNRLETEGLIGFFVNTLALRTKFTANQSFRELLAQVRQTVLEAYNHQDVPFEKLVEELQPERDTSRSPLFQVMFSLDNPAEENLTCSDLTLSPFYVQSDEITAKFDLTLVMVDTEEGLKGIFEYNTDLFAPATIKRMVGHWQVLLEAITTNPDLDVNLLPFITAAEKQQLLTNSTQIEYPQHLGIHDLFAAQAQKTPDAVAVKQENKTLTYAELNTRANQLAHYLQELGVTTEVKVGICLERSPEMIVAVLAILKAGGAYVPLDPNYPTQRLEWMLEDSQVKVLLTTEKLQEKLPEHKAKVICFDSHQKIIAAYPQTNPETQVKPENLAYIIYTSGSTGKPKGVMIEHHSLTSFTCSAVAEYQITQQDTVLQFASLSFDVAVEEIYPCLITGGTVVLRTDEMLNSLPTFVAKCQEWGVTVLDLPTAYWHQLTYGLVSQNLTLPESVRLLIFGGEAASPETVRIWLENIGEYPQLINAYGPTETTVEATTYKFTVGVNGPSGEILLTKVAHGGNPQDRTFALFSSRETRPTKVSHRSPLQNREIPIGKPISNAQVYILDKNLQQLPIGIPGEIYIGGTGVARGYLNRPELTQQKFIPNPFVGTFHGTSLLYKTGDLGKYLPNGNIEYLGRIDNQVKIRGFRIELGEIETLLNQHSDIQQAVVIAREDVPGDKRLVAYVVLNQNQTLTSEQMRGFLQQDLPNYMIPSLLVILDRIPLTPNDKIDRAALPKPEGDRAGVDNAYFQPETEIEARIATIWQQVLQVNEVGIY